MMLIRSHKEKSRTVGKESLYFLREYLCNLEQNVGRTMDGKDHVVDFSDGNEEHVIG